MTDATTPPLPEPLEGVSSLPVVGWCIENFAGYVSDACKKLGQGPGCSVAMTPHAPAQAAMDAMRVELDTWRTRVTEAHSEREAAVSAHEAAQRAGFSFRDEVINLRRQLARLGAGLQEVCTVLETNTTAIVDTVWVSTGQPETLLDHCRSLLDGAALKALQPVAVERVMELADNYAQALNTADLSNIEVWRSEDYRGKRAYERDAAREALRTELTKGQA